MSLVLGMLTAHSAVAATTDRGDLPGWYNPADSSWHLGGSLSNSPSIYAFAAGPIGVPNLQAVTGDWNGDGQDTVGYYNPADSSFHLSDTMSNSGSNYAFVFGPIGVPNLQAVIGDWNGDGYDTVGWYNPADSSWHLTDKSTGAGASDYAFVAGPIGVPNLQAVTGDWNGDGKDTIGYYNPADSSYHLSDSMSNAGSNYAFVAGPIGVPNLQAVTGDWNGDGKDTIGYYNPADSSYHLTNSMSNAGSNYAFVFGPIGVPDLQPVMGDWDGFVPPPTTPPGQAAAAAMLATGRVSGNSESMAQINGVASGSPISHVFSGQVRSCNLDAALLTTLRTLVVDRGFRIYVTSFNRWCTNTLTDSGTSSYHWRNGGGHAIDIGIVNGVVSTGGTANDISFIQQFATLVPKPAGIGQKNCRGAIALPAGVTTFNDTCNHVHLEYRG